MRTVKNIPMTTAIHRSASAAHRRLDGDNPAEAGELVPRFESLSFTDW